MSSSGTHSAATDAFVAGAMLVANAVLDLRIEVGDQGSQARAIATIRAHDFRSSLPEDVQTLAQRPFAVTLAPRPASWEEGFADALEALAHEVPLTHGPKRQDAVAVVGLPLDRLEPDRLSDLEEIERLLTGIGLSVVSVWPAGRLVADLARVAEASFIVALPYGRAAAETLARRTGGVLVDAGIPFGLGGSVAFVSGVAKATGRVSVALTSRELDRVVPRLEWVVPLWLLHRRFAFAGDAFLARPFADFLAEFGAETVAWDRTTPVDLLVASRPHVEEAALARVPWLEWGFPSPGAHSLARAPRLGFDGALCCIEAFVNRLSLCEVLKGIERQRGARTGP